MLLRRSRLAANFLSGMGLFGDGAYVGMGKVYPEPEVVTPMKKPRGGELSDERRGYNR